MLPQNRLKGKEKDLHQQVVDYLRIQYPKVIWRTDFAAGIRMTIGQAVRHKRLQQSRAWPDLMILHPTIAGNVLFIELKRSPDEIYTKDGKLRTDAHTQEQAAILARLNGLGYITQFGCGFEHTKGIIDSWINNYGTETLTPSKV